MKERGSVRNRSWKINYDQRSDANRPRLAALVNRYLKTEHNDVKCWDWISYTKRHNRDLRKYRLLNKISL